jgi:hypothetical protein
MRKAILVGLVAAFILIESPKGLAGDVQKIAVTVLGVNESDSPLRIISLKRTPPTRNSDVVLENISDKTATAVRFHFAIGVPSGCSKNLRKPHIVIADSNSDVPEEMLAVEGLHLRPVTIPPHGRGRTITNLIRAGNLVRDAKRENSHYLHVQLAVEMVQFSDGMVWKAPLLRFPEHNEAFAGFSEKLLQKDELLCREFVSAGSGKLDFAGVLASPLLPSNPDNFQSLSNELGYTFVCEVQNDVVVCPLK